MAAGVVCFKKFVNLSVAAFSLIRQKHDLSLEYGGNPQKNWINPARLSLDHYAGLGPSPVGLEGAGFLQIGYPAEIRAPC